MTEKLQNMICQYVILTDKATDNDFSSSWVNAGGKMQTSGLTVVLLKPVFEDSNNNFFFLTV